MKTNIRQYYDIKFPFTTNNLEGFFIDLNEEPKDKVLSELLHVITTPKKSRLRMPDFGTDLIKYIFELNDESTWAGIKSEIQSAVSKYVKNVILNDIKVYRDEGEEQTILIDLDYSVKVGVTSENNKVVVKL